MDVERMVSDTVASVITGLAQRSASVTVDKVKELVGRLADRDPEAKRNLDLDDLVEKITASDGAVGREAEPVGPQFRLAWSAVVLGLG